MVRICVLFQRIRMRYNPDTPRKLFEQGAPEGGISEDSPRYDHYAAHHQKIARDAATRREQYAATSVSGGSMVAGGQLTHHDGVVGHVLGRAAGIIDGELTEDGRSTAKTEQANTQLPDGGRIIDAGVVG